MSDPARMLMHKIKRSDNPAGQRADASIFAQNPRRAVGATVVNFEGLPTAKRIRGCKLFETRRRAYVARHDANTPRPDARV